MECVYKDDRGICSIWEEGLIWNGVTEDGICFCTDEDDPSKSCVLFDLDRPDGADCDYE